MRSPLATAACLSLIHQSAARVPHSFREVIQRDAEPESEVDNGLFNWITKLVRRQFETTSADDTPANAASSDDVETCYIDGYYDFVQGLGQQFCQDFMTYPNVTVTVEYTPTSTLTTRSTVYKTNTVLERYTPTSTVTVTVSQEAAAAKRNAKPMITARGLSQMEIHRVFENFRRQNGESTSIDNAASMSSAFSSACNCQDYQGPTETVSYTNAVVVETLSAFDRGETEVTTTTTAALYVVTETVTADATTSMASSTSSSGPTPTAPAFTCPDDHSVTVSQMVGNERYDYHILCDTVLMDADLYGGALNYSSFTECASACSVANGYFDYPVCQGVSFFMEEDDSNGNCFLKSSAENTVAAVGVESALLQTIAVGVTNTTLGGTTTEKIPLADETMTMEPSAIGSYISSAFRNSSNSISMVTPFPSIVKSGMLVQASVTAYSTYTSGGSTFSSGTAYSTYYTDSNGVWYSYYFTSFTQQWASATTVYGATETGYTLQNTTNSESSETSGDNGEYTVTTVTNSTDFSPGWRNVTEVITNITYDQDGTEIYSTETTSYFTYATAVAGGGAYGSAGAPSTVSATPTWASPFPSVTLSTGGTSGASSTLISGLVNSTQTSPYTVIATSGGTGDASSFLISGQVTQSPVPSVIVSSGETEFASSYLTSGVFSTGTAVSSVVSIIASSGGTGLPWSYITSGLASYSTAPSVIASSGETAFASSYLISGLLSTGTTVSSPISVGSSTGGTGFASSYIISGLPSSSTSPSSPGSVAISAGETGGASSFLISGSITSTVILNSTVVVSGTSGASSTLLSGAPSSSPTGSFSNTGGDRDLQSSSTVASGSAPVGTGPSTTGPFPYPSSNSTALSGSLVSPGSATSTPSGTAPTLSTGPAYSFPTSMSMSSGPSTSETTPVPVANSTGPIGYPSPSGSYGASQESRSLYPSSGTAPLGTAPPSSPIGYPSSSPSTSAGNLTAPLDTTTAPSGTGPSTTPFPMSSSICTNMTMDTTTIFSTTTVYGCFSTCMPEHGGYGGYGGYGGGPAVPFGPPAWARPTPPPVEDDDDNED